MSLINDMLRNLEARRGSTMQLPPGLVHGGAQPPRPAIRSNLWVMALAVAAVVTAILAWWTWPHDEPTPPQPQMLQSLPERPHAGRADIPVTAPPGPPDAPAPPPAATAVTPPVTVHPAPPRAAPTPPASIEKLARPPTPQQHAEQEYQRGVRALRGNNHASAETALRSALQQDPEHLLARETLAALLLGAGRLIEAGEVLEQGQYLFAHNPTLALLLARLRLAQGQGSAAISILEQHLHAATTRADYLAFLGAVYQRELRYTDSIESYNRALALQPHQASWWVGLGVSLENAGRRDDAIKAYEHAASGVLAAQLMEHVRQRLEALR